MLRCTVAQGMRMRPRRVSVGDRGGQTRTIETVVGVRAVAHDELDSISGANRRGERERSRGREQSLVLTVVAANTARWPPLIVLNISRYPFFAGVGKVPPPCAI
jgi:hypothetical protein